jgi:ankyrin repeat protein
LIENEFAKEPIDKLTWAAYCGDLTEIEKYLNMGIDINSYDRNGETPLIVAIENAEIEAVKFLLQKGADPNKKSLYGCSPLEWFINLEEDVLDNGFELSTETIDLLYDFGADLNIKNEANQTPLDIAIKRNHYLAEKRLTELIFRQKDSKI